MKMSEKICSKCGNKVSGDVKFCPMCRSQSFRNINEISKPKNTLVHKLFYYDERNHYILSKSKVGALFVFLIFLTTNFILPTRIISAFIFSVIAYLIGLSVHKLTNPKVSPGVLKNNDYGLLTDLKHLLFYWQDKKTGEHEFSKTKMISFLMFVLVFLISPKTGESPFFVNITAALIIAVPIFIIGYAVHRLTSSEPVKKVVEKTQPVIHKKEAEPKTEIKIKPKSEVYHFSRYRRELNEIKMMYEIKERNARDLIEKRFTPPQLTYDKFISSVDNSTKMFNIHSEVILNIIDMASQDSEKIDHELNDRLDILKTLLKKMDELIDELVLSLNDDEKEGDPTNLINELDDLIDSVKSY